MSELNELEQMVEDAGKDEMIQKLQLQLQQQQLAIMQMKQQNQKVEGLSEKGQEFFTMMKLFLDLQKQAESSVYEKLKVAESFVGSGDVEDFSEPSPLDTLAEGIAAGLAQGAMPKVQGPPPSQEPTVSRWPEPGDE